jgi:hypothetical protein
MGDRINPVNGGELCYQRAGQALFVHPDAYRKLFTAFTRLQGWKVSS